uniref:Uncharacterized protein n=1 Tax=Candidatus Kentrum sp. TC TaxID=2126339 RepID=A0A450ZFL7_9GAMM|nr:MAG: hypothetical protein BECKTC1821D_GA0114238_11913 [Candidatus Kentron sp. TC]
MGKNPTNKTSVFISVISGASGGLLLILIGHPLSKLFLPGESQSPNASDVISIANTYIVFTTFIFVMITIMIAISSMWFSKWFGSTKDKEIRENQRELLDKLESDPKLADTFISTLLKQQKVEKRVKSVVEPIIDEYTDKLKTLATKELPQRTTKTGEEINFSGKLTEESGREDE